MIPDVLPEILAFCRYEVAYYWGKGKLHKILTTAAEMYKKQMFLFVQFSVTIAH